MHGVGRWGRQTVRRWLRLQFARAAEALRPKLDQSATIQYLSSQLSEARRIDYEERSEYMESLSELREARNMSGSGPWTIGPEAAAQTDKILATAYEAWKPGVQLRESNILAQGANGLLDLELDLLNWRRETSLAWMEFSRWGIQQIILICRLNYVKNTYIRRCIDIAAAYVFGRGVEVSSDNQAANDTLQDFFERNARVLGQIGLTNLEKRKYYDGNLFFAFFIDEQNSGDVNVRTIDATEIQDIISNPEDSDEPWLYLRKWTQRSLNLATGQVESRSAEAYYPDIDYTPSEKPPTIGKIPVMWGNPILHRKCGAIAKWHFGCPLIFPALPWAKTARKFLESIYTVKKALAQFAFTLTTKGGQAAIEGAKNALGTRVGPNHINGAWDTNPSAADGSTFASGPGTKLEAFKTAGAGGNPEDVRRYIHCIAMTVGIPETWLADASVGTVATAQSLDRPTELNFMSKQEEWREDLTAIAKFVLAASNKAVGGKLRNAFKSVGVTGLRIVECARVRNSKGGMVYEAVAKPNTIQVKVTFPAIREGDMAANVKAIAEAMTLDNKGGQVVGIDEKVGVGLLYKELGVEDSEDILDKQYPKKYDPDRTVEPLPAPIGKALPDIGGVPQAPGGHDVPAQDKPVPTSTESRRSRGAMVRRLQEALRKLGKAA